MEALTLFAKVIGSVFLALATLVACLNFYLSWIRPFYFWLTKKEYKWVSGLPAFGTIFLIFAGILLPKNLYLGCFALVLIFMDTGGLPWFVLVMTYQWLCEPKNKNPN